jgi:hypothetical protein
VLAGKYLVGEDAVRILGRPAFHDIQLVSGAQQLAGPHAFGGDRRRLLLLPAPFSSCPLSSSSV